MQYDVYNCNMHVHANLYNDLYIGNGWPIGICRVLNMLAGSEILKFIIKLFAHRVQVDKIQILMFSCTYI